MNPAFKFNFGDIGGEKSGKADESSNAGYTTQQNYTQAGYNRNICFHWLDGKCSFLNYSYLVTAELVKDQTLIVVEFTTHTVRLSGFYLQALFDDLMHQIVMHVHCTDARYNLLLEEKLPVVNSIDMQKNE